MVEVIHPGLAGVSKKDLQEKLCKMYKVQDSSCCLLFGFKVAFGGVFRCTSDLREEVSGTQHSF